MKHTNFYPQLTEIKKKEYQELYQAIKAHGGEYSWGTEDEEGDWWFNLGDYPTVAVNTTGYIPQPMDICIRSVRIENDRIKLEGEDNEFGNRIEFRTDDVFAGHLSYITDLIPATEQVSEVKAVPKSFRDALKASMKSTLTHSMGKKNKNETVLTVSEFCSRLTDLRDYGKLSF